MRTTAMLIILGVWIALAVVGIINPTVPVLMEQAVILAELIVVAWLEKRAS